MMPAPKNLVAKYREKDGGVFITKVSFFGLDSDGEVEMYIHHEDGSFDTIQASNFIGVEYV